MIFPIVLLTRTFPDSHRDRPLSLRLRRKEGNLKGPARKAPLSMLERGRGK